MKVFRPHHSILLGWLVLLSLLTFCSATSSRRNSFSLPFLHGVTLAAQALKLVDGGSKYSDDKFEVCKNDVCVFG